MHDRRDARLIDRYMVLKTVLANIAEQFLEPRDLHYAESAKGIQRVVGKGPLADIGGDFTGKVIG